MSNNSQTRETVATLETLSMLTQPTDVAKYRNTVDSIKAALCHLQHFAATLPAPDENCGDVPFVDRDQLELLVVIKDRLYEASEAADEFCD